MMERVSYYQIEHLLGRGGSSTVYRALDTRSGSRVALKVLHPHLAGDRGYLARFRREAQIASRLRSPHIARVLDSGSEGDVHFLAMEYVDGTSLGTLLSQGRIRSERAIAIAGQVCLALIEAHAQGIIHRDIKPQNVMLDAAGVVKVTDFGVARWEGQAGITTDGLYLGTPEYMSPEHIGGSVDARSDIYSLGIVMYQMLAGSVPFSGSPYAVIDMQVRARPAGLAQANPMLPAWLCATVERCLEKDPKRRFASAEALLGALQARESPPAPMPSPATPSPLPPPTSRPLSTYLPPPRSPRKPGVSGAVFAGCVIVAVVVAAAASGFGQGAAVFAVIACVVVALLGVLSLTGKDRRAWTLRFDAGDSFDLRGGSSVIGRGYEASVRLSAPEVSRQHASLTLQAGRVILEDLGSVNGTFLNGSRLTGPVEVLEGDEVSFAGVRARLTMPGGRRS